MLSCSGLTVILGGTHFADEEMVQRGEAICQGHTARSATGQSKGQQSDRPEFKSDSTFKDGPCYSPLHGQGGCFAPLSLFQP